MTEKEKAIEWLKACKETNYRHYPTIQGYMDMAISALSENKGEDRPKGEYVKLDEVTEILADVLCIPNFFDRNILESDVSKAYNKIIDLDRVQI